MRVLKDAGKATVVAIALNIVLSLLLNRFATSEEVKPTNGAASLSLKGLFIKSFIVGLVVFLSVVLGNMIPY